MTPPRLNESGWLEISIQAAPALHDALSSFLFDLGCTGIVTEAFQDDTLRAYLPFQENLEEIRNRMDLFLQDLKTIFDEVSPPSFRFKRLENQEWGLAWRRFFRPARITPNLLIFPAWEPLPQAFHGHIIRMDPGPAFGTGQHPTTRMCLEAMERVPLREHWTLLDVGTGSGILAIYGAKRDAAKVLALDTDPEAIRWAGENIRLNDVAGSIELSTEPVETMRGVFTLICANLMLREIVRLMPSFSALMEEEGWLVLSGILDRQVQEVTQPLLRNGLKAHRILRQAEWACIISAKGDSAPL